MIANISQQIFKQGSVTYYYSSLFFPKDVRQAVFDLYAFVRTVDDLVDRPIPDVDTLKHFFSETSKSLTGKATSHNQIVANFAHIASHYQFSPEWVESFFESMRWDLKPSPYATFNDLEKYIYGSAEVIGLMMARILGLPTIANDSARLLGKSMQFVNFIRDIKEDTLLGRQYLPQSDLDRFELSTLSPKTSKDLANFRRLIRFELDRYFQIQKQAQAGFSYIPRPYLLPIATASDGYYWTAKRLYQSPLLPLQQKIRPSKIRIFSYFFKNLILPRALALPSF